jgi:hypothetical protein
MSIVIAIVIAAVLVLAAARAMAWAQENRKTRFSFEDRDTYLFLKLERPLGSDDSGVVAMRTLREALSLKLEGAGYQRVLVEVSDLHIANTRAFWLMIGALAPAQADEKIRLAVVCKRRTPAAKFFRETGVLNPIPSVREGERCLRSEEPLPRLRLDQRQLDSLLDPGQRKAA